MALNSTYIAHYGRRSFCDDRPNQIPLPDEKRGVPEATDYPKWNIVTVLRLLVT